MWKGKVSTPVRSIERTAYSRFHRAPSVKELREIYTPTPGDVAFVSTTARGPRQKYGLMILLKVYSAFGLFSQARNHSWSHYQPYSRGHETPSSELNSENEISIFK